MWAPLTLFVALWVIFAPGWGRESGAGVAPGSDLAARVLAPTFDHGALREASLSKLQVPNEEERSTGEDAALPAIAAALLIATYIARVLRWRPPPVGTERYALHLSRAPPRHPPS